MVRDARILGCLLILALVPSLDAADDPVPLTNCDALIGYVDGFDSLGDLLTNLKGDPFADAFGVYIRDIEQLDREGRDLSQQIRDVARNDCEPYMREYSQWTFAAAEFRNSGCEGQLTEEQYAGCKPRLDNLTAWHDRLETQRAAAQTKINDRLQHAVSFVGRAKMPLRSGQSTRT